MPSATYERFLAQLHAQGREKGDGFDPSNFDGLSADERPRVREQLIDALLDGDGAAARGLVVFDSAAATATLDSILDERRYPHRVGLDIATALWAHTHDARYVDDLLLYATDSTAPARLQALFQLQGAPCTPRLREAMRTAVMNDPDGTNRSYAAKQLLFCAGLVPSPDDAYNTHREFMLELRNPDRRTRQAALGRVDAAARA